MRLPNGYGSVVKLSGNRRKPYAVRISYTDNSGPKPIRKQKYLSYFEKKEQALIFLADYNNGNVIPEHQKYAHQLTFAELYDKWKKYRHTQKSNPTEQTWRNYDIAFNRFSSIHPNKVVSIRMQDLQDILDLNSSKSETTLGNMKAILHGMWEYAIIKEYLEKNITEHLTTNSSFDGEPIHTRFTNSEIQALWNALGIVNNVDIVLIYIYTGMRPSELLEIKREDVHIDERYIRGGMKTEAGRNRIIPIHKSIIPLIENRLNQMRPYLITNKYGNKYTYGVYAGSNFKTCMEKMKMDHVPHDCRYTFASLADDNNMNIICKKIIMGHSLGNKSSTAFKTGSKSDVTTGIYTEKTLEQLIEAIDILPTYFGDITI